MNKHLTAILIALLALMLAGIVFAVSRLYRPVVEEDTPVSSDAYPLLRAVPMDAVAVFSFDGGKPSRRVVADSTGLLRTFLSAEIFPVIQHFGACPMAVSLHNSGMLVPLVAVRPEKADSLVLPAGLKSARVEDMLLISSSETLLGASQRHIEEKMSVLGTEGMARLCARMGGGATVFLANQQASKLLQMYAAPQVRQYASVAKHLADWMAFHLDADGKEVLLQGTASVSSPLSMDSAAGPRKRPPSCPTTCTPGCSCLSATLTPGWSAAAISKMPGGVSAPSTAKSAADRKNSGRPWNGPGASSSARWTGSPCPWKGSGKTSCC